MFAVARAMLFGGLSGKALGVARELVTAGLFGTGPVAVAYRLSQAAFLIPLHGFFSEAFGAGFTPAYARSRVSDVERSRALFAVMHATVVAVSLAAAALLMVFTSRWVDLLAPGFDAATAEMARQMVAVLAIAMPFYSLSGLYAAAEVAVGKARIASARASAQNLGLIVGTAVAWWREDPVYIAAGFVAAYVVLSAWGFAGARAAGLSPWPRRGEWSASAQELAGVWRAVRTLMLVPVMLQVHFIIERRVASIVSPEAVAALDYARFLSDTAVLLLAVPLGTAGLGAMPTMSERAFRDAAHRSARLLLFIGVPLSVAVALHGETIVRLVYARGAFDERSVAETTAILQWLAVGLWAQLIGYAGAKFLSARNRNVSVIGIQFAAAASNVVLNLALYRVLGTAALGVAAGVNSIVFGALTLHRIGILGQLRGDFVTVGVLAAAYTLLWFAAPPSASSQWWLPLSLFAVFWCTAVIVVPRCRNVLHEAWLALREA